MHSSQATQTTATRSRYRPEHGGAPIQLTERDVAMIKRVLWYRVASARHILDFVRGSKQGAGRRLKLLTAHRYLCRIVNPDSTYYTGGGSSELLYGIGPASIPVLEDHGVPRSMTEWLARSNDRIWNDPKVAGRKIVPHALFAADIMADIERFCDESAGAVRFLDEEAVLNFIGGQGKSFNRVGKNPFSWAVTIIENEREESIGIVPDRIFALEHRDAPEGSKRIFFFLEADRNTETIVPSSLKGSSIYRKMLAYTKTYSDKIHSERFGMNFFRVLTITTSQGHAARMTAAYKRATMQLAEQVRAAKKEICPPGVMLFAGRATRNPHHVLDYHWIDGRGKAVVLKGLPFRDIDSFCKAVCYEIDRRKLGEDMETPATFEKRVTVTLQLGASREPNTYPVLLRANATIGERPLQLTMSCGDVINRDKQNAEEILAAESTMVNHARWLYKSVIERVQALDCEVEEPGNMSGHGTP